MRFGNIEYTQYTALLADRMYLCAAKDALERARVAWQVVQNRQGAVNKLNAEIDRITEKHKDNIERIADRLDRLSVSLVERAWPRLEDAYGPFVAECAIVHICCAAATEACINALARKLLQPADYGGFDKLSLDGKWRLLPKLVGKSGLDPGRQPMQGFIQSIKYRNRLMHHKATREPFEIGAVAPKTLQSLGLNLKAAEESSEAATACIESMSAILQESADDDSSVARGFFRWTVETRPASGSDAVLSARNEGGGHHG